MPHDDRQIEVYAGAEHLCTAYPTGQLTPSRPMPSAPTPAPRPNAWAANGAGHHAGPRRELAPMTGDGTAAVESRLVAATDGRARTQQDRDQALAARASTSLLGLIDPTADPES